LPSVTSGIVSKLLRLPPFVVRDEGRSAGLALLSASGLDASAGTLVIGTGKLDFLFAENSEEGGLGNDDGIIMLFRLDGGADTRGTGADSGCELERK